VSPPRAWGGLSPPCPRRCTPVRSVALRRDTNPCNPCFPVSAPTVSAPICVLPHAADCRALVLPLAWQDYIRSPKPNGFRALHSTVQLGETGYFVEVQLRGRTMHEQAERGAASHSMYKAQLEQPQKLIGEALPLPRRPLLPATRERSDESAEAPSKSRRNTPT
jgi:hypothetical protein